ncbi:DNA polymerase III subunit alpha [Blattabacterium cuenoti]|uniref:DNA polymerase III subunit alpha n=1 Tax=Blattabacterium cuenoti TaxID=1653831 RepID=UPI00163D1E6E|nr:DNA polymerase III subunit alpha [Blattabacterium cuenoti]
MYLIVDTETTGLPISYNFPINRTDSWPRIVQFSWQIHDVLGDLIKSENFIVKPDHYDIPFNAFKIHGITNDKAEKYGYNLDFVLSKFKEDFEKYQCLIGHNLEFDRKVIECEFFRKKIDISFKKKKIIDTKEISVSFCKILAGNKKKFKWPTLSELYQKLFEEKIQNLHNSASDVKSTARCFLELLRIGVISHREIGVKEDVILKFRNKFPKKISYSIVDFKITDLFSFPEKKKRINYNFKKKYEELKGELKEKLKKKRYSHIHNHTHFSILYSTIDIQSMIDRAILFNMPSVGITDYGNMMGSFHFLNAIHSTNKKYYPKKSIKGIVGCEIFISENYLQNKFTKDEPDKRYLQVLLSKNKKGYYNLSKLCSLGFTEGFYAGFPRIGKKLIEKYKENLIALTGDLNAEIPYTILNHGERKAEKIFLWWKDLFGDDFYIELLRHGLEEEDYVNKILLKFSQRYHVKYIIQNNTFYLDQREANAHDILLCVKKGAKQSTPIGKGIGYRLGFPNHEFYFKDSEKMKVIFSDVPEAFDFLEELVNKVESYNISNEILLPKFQIPKSFENPIDKIDGGNRGENHFLKTLTYEGAKKRYKNLTEEIKDRISFELKTIEKIGYPGYFLIVQNFIHQAKKMNISVGPGRGSVAGSVVAYCIGITSIDPIKYNLLFERFLNPDRISLPDIDIDFDDKGREKIIEWVVQKYGKNQVAQIITYSTMGAKSAIRDTGRVLNLPLRETDTLAKMVPNMFSLKTILSENYSIDKTNVNKGDKNNILKLRSIARNKNDLKGKVLHQAKILEGTIRSTGVHACGLIISPYNIKEYIPVSVSKESDLLLTQFDNHVVEHVGLLKMDFLGLKTLTIIKNAINLIKKRHKNIKDFSFSLKDEKTYSLFQEGKTVAIFQYESPGMQKYLRQLKPDKFNDLIAMNALYRPGPMQYIPNFISRKHGKEAITYDLPEMEEFLKETYGITVYQEQVMLIAQKIANFSRGDADFLRIAMGKKQKKLLNKMRNQFIETALKKGYSQKILEKIWKDWEYFSCYAFNKSHATCYAYIAFQTAYLKAHFPHEYMASVLSSNMHDIKQLTFFIEECKKNNISVINPDINESDSFFEVTNSNQIRFGLTGIKGVGKNAVRVILNERNKNGPYTSIFDLVKRIDLRVVNKKTMESLILSGSLDCFNINKKQYFYVKSNDKLSILEKIIRFGSKFQKEKKNNSINKINQSIIKKCNNKKLSDNKEMLGIYTTSTHYLDDYSHEIKYFTNLPLLDKANKEFTSFGNRIRICGILSRMEKKTYIKSGIKYGIFLLEDYNSYKDFLSCGKKYLKYEPLLSKKRLLYLIVFIKNLKYKEQKINVLHIENVNNVLTKLVHQLIINININDLNSRIINSVEKLISRKNGYKKLSVILSDKESKIFLDFESIKYGVNINSNFLKKLEKINGLHFFLNIN